MPHVQARRRRVLRSTAGLAALGLAGCLGAPASTAGQDESTATGTPESDATDHHEDSDHGTDGHDHSPTEHESGHGHDHDEPVTPPTDAATVAMTTMDAGDHFEPHVVRVNNGGTVTWVNESGMHTATAYHPANDKPLLMPEGAEPFDSGLLTEAGAEFSRTFEMPGVYHVYCAPHEAVGMLGSVIVGEPDPHEQPALQAVPSSLPETAQRKLVHLNEKCNEALGHTH
jgi:plastocyanin